MDLGKIVKMLQARKAQLETEIGILEKLQSGAPVYKKRGRRGMPEEERRQVSARMKAYWAKRQQAAGQAS